MRRLKVNAYHPQRLSHESCNVQEIRGAFSYAITKYVAPGMTKHPNKASKRPVLQILQYCEVERKVELSEQAFILDRSCTREEGICCSCLGQSPDSTEGCSLEHTFTRIKITTNALIIYITLHLVKKTDRESVVMGGSTAPAQNDHGVCNPE